MNRPDPIPIAELLTAAATVLEQAGEMPPVMVACSPAEQFLDHVTITPASLTMSRSDQAAVVQAVAAGTGWTLGPLLDVKNGFTSKGTAGGVRIKAWAAPLMNTDGRQTRTGNATTAAHADLLRALVDWSAGVPASAVTLEIREDLDVGTFTARLVLSSDADVKEVPGLIITDDRRVSWSGFCGAGVLPTGHAFTVSVGRC